MVVVVVVVVKPVIYVVVEISNNNTTYNPCNNFKQNLQRCGHATVDSVGEVVPAQRLDPKGCHQKR